VDPTFDSDFFQICYNHNHIIWWDLSHIEKAENLFLTKFLAKVNYFNFTPILVKNKFSVFRGLLLSGFTTVFSRVFFENLTKNRVTIRG